MTQLVGVYGVSGFGREVMPLVQRQYSGVVGRIVFIDDASEAVNVNGHDVLTWQEFVADPSANKRACIAIASSKIRELLAARCAEAGIALLDVRAANALVLDDVVIGEGALLTSFVHLTSNIRIGRCFHANIYSYVAHDCVIGDFVTFGPGVKCNGNVVIEDHAYIGTGAILRQGTPEEPLIIGRGATVGMGAVVTRSVAPGITVVGNPARLLLKG